MTTLSACSLAARGCWARARFALPSRPCLPTARHGTVLARPVQVHRVLALTSAVHSVVEQVEVMLPDGLHQAAVLATNVYHKTPEGWRMVAHHASPGTAPDVQVVDAQRPVLH